MLTACSLAAPAAAPAGGVKPAATREPGSSVASGVVQGAAATLSFLGPQAASALAPVIASFEAKTPGLKVAYESAPFAGFNEVIQTRLGAKDTGPDLYTADQPRIRALVSRGFLEDLTEQVGQARGIVAPALWRTRRGPDHGRRLLYVPGDRRASSLPVDRRRGRVLRVAEYVRPVVWQAYNRRMAWYAHHEPAPSWASAWSSHGCIATTVSSPCGSSSAAALTSEYGPHWCPPSFPEWRGHATFWHQLVDRVGVLEPRSPALSRVGPQGKGL